MSQCHFEFIADCIGSWTLGVGEWPKAGEIDMYEGWNLNVFNKPAIHAGSATEFGNCTISQADQKATVISNNCDNTFADNVRQFLNQGCQSEETQTSIWGSSEGGIRMLPTHNVMRRSTDQFSRGSRVDTRLHQDIYLETRP